MGIVKESLYKLSSPRFLTRFRSQSIYPYYHIVRDTKARHIENLYEYKNVEQFKSDLDLLTEHYKALNPNQLLAGNRIKNTFLLSFDDGLSEIYTHIFPILKAKNLNAIFFINPDFVDNENILYKHSISLIIDALKQTGFRASELNKIAAKLSITYESNHGFVDKLKATKFSDRQLIGEVLEIVGIDVQDYLKSVKPYITKSQIAEMIDAGFFFGGHTMSHPPLHQLSFEDQKSEIINSIEWLKTNFAIDYAMFAFPFSDKNISKQLLDELFTYDENLLLFGNSGIKKDYDNRIIQRFSLENPHKQTAKTIVTENLYKLFNKVSGNYQIKRR